MQLATWLSTAAQYPTDLTFSIPQDEAEALKNILNEVGGFSVKTLMDHILDEGFQMDELEFTTGVVDEMLSVALESYCNSFGVDIENVGTHELGSTVRLIAANSISCLAEIALAVREQLLSSKIPVIDELNMCAYAFVSYDDGVFHLAMRQSDEISSIFKFRDNQKACEMLSRLTSSLTSPTLY